MVSLTQMANSASNAQNFSYAETLYVKILPLCPEVYGEESTETLDAMTGLCRALVFQNKTEQGIELGQEALELSIRLNGREHPDTLRINRNLLTAYSHTSMSIDLLTSKTEEALEDHLRILPWDNRGTLVLMNNLADIYLGEFKIIKAENIKLEELAVRKRISGESDFYYLENKVTLAQIYYEAGEYEMADEVSRFILSRLEPSRSDTGSYLFTKILHGCVLSHLGLKRAGEESIKIGSDGLFKKNSLLMDDACSILFRHYISLGQYDRVQSL